MARRTRSLASTALLLLGGFFATASIAATSIADLALVAAAAGSTTDSRTVPMDRAASTTPAMIDDAERLPQPALKPLFPERSIKGWHIVGGLAKFTMQDGVLTGSGADTRNAFLVSPRNYGDFVLDLELRIVEGNSGIQVRSQVREDEGSGSLVGYQVEVDPTPRAWSGGIYDEGRRGWLFDLKDNEAARDAFKAGSGTDTSSNAAARGSAPGSTACLLQTAWTSWMRTGASRFRSTPAGPPCSGAA